MIQLKEIKQKEYMRGTKAFRLRMYIFAGLIGFSAVVSIPLYFLIENKKKFSQQKTRLENEEVDLRKLEEVYKINEMLYGKKN